jgi:hypothetical protein
VEQLTQLELIHLEELLGMEALAVKKYQLYQEQCKEKELVPFLQEAVSLHQARIEKLINQIRNHNGRTPTH